MAQSVLGVLALVALQAFAATASAASITWAFTGVVRVVEIQGGSAPDRVIVAAAANSLGAIPGQPVSGFIRFESETPDRDPAFSPGLFLDAIEDGSLTLVGGSLGMVPDLNPDDPYDPYRLIGIGSTAEEVPPEPGASGLNAQLDLADTTGLLSFLLMGLELSSLDPTFFDPTVLPVDPPVLAALDPFGPGGPTSAFGYGTELFLGGGRTGAFFIARTELTSLARVPEPSGLALLALALLAVRYPRAR